MSRPRGRKPKPTHLKLVTGTARASRLNEDEPKLDPGIPQVPEHLSDDAKVEWGRVSQELYSAGIITRVDRGILAAYCQAYGRWVSAERALAEMAKRDEVFKSLMVSTKSGNLIQNPLVGIANKAMADMARYATDLGMTPSARSRVHAAATAGQSEDPASKYIG